MTDIDYGPSGLPVRDSLTDAHRRAWKRLASPGTWLTADERVQVAEETRHAPHCRLCATRAEAVSPYTVDGEHDACSSLTPAWVEIVHRVRTDQSRITDAWYEGLLAGGVFAAEYVELVGVVATVMAVDGFCEALDVPLHELPPPLPGEPAQTMPAGARAGLARVPTVAPEDVTEAEADLYDGLSGAHIHRALSLVPAEVWGFFDLDGEMYLPDRQLRDFGREYRHITHAQQELLAARVSALNRCYY